ncbi:MAG: aminoacyl-tRNA hydrolase, partial [Actinomycetota bacterium]
IARTGLHDVVRARVEAAYGPTLTATSSSSRSQWRNRQSAWRAALERLDEAATPPAPPRARTRPSRGAREDRLRDKHQASARKQSRQRPSRDD